MNTRQLKEFCGRLPGAVTRSYGPPNNILVYAVDDKQFAYFKTSEPEKWRFSIRTTPDRFVELTDVPGIKPARYMARFHWVTIVDPNSVPRAYLTELIAWSHAKALAALSKKRRDALIAPPQKPVS
jgi:predicted DNA-binding protein (MmcQ/YjbR family)